MCSHFPFFFDIEQMPCSSLRTCVGTNSTLLSVSTYHMRTRNMISFAESSIYLQFRIHVLGPNEIASLFLADPYAWSLKDIGLCPFMQVSLLGEKILPRTNLPPLLIHLRERHPEKLCYIGVSFGATRELFRFWRKHNFLPFYIGQIQVSIFHDQFLFFSSINFL